MESFRKEVINEEGFLRERRLGTVASEDFFLSNMQLLLTGKELSRDYDGSGHFVWFIPSEYVSVVEASQWCREGVNDSFLLHLQWE